MSYESVCDVIIEERDRLKELSALYYKKASHSRRWKSRKYRERARKCSEDVEKLEKLISVMEEN